MTVSQAEATWTRHDGLLIDLPVAASDTLRAYRACHREMGVCPWEHSHYVSQLTSCSPPARTPHKLILARLTQSGQHDCACTSCIIHLSPCCPLPASCN